MTLRQECVACKRKAVERSAAERSRSANPRRTIYGSPKTPSASVPVLNSHVARKRTSSTNPSERPHFTSDTIASAQRRREPYQSPMDPSQHTPKKTRPSMLERKFQQGRSYLQAHNVDIAHGSGRFSSPDVCAHVSRSGMTLHQMKCESAAQAALEQENSNITDVSAILRLALHSQAAEDLSPKFRDTPRRYSESDITHAELKHAEGCDGGFSSRNSIVSSYDATEEPSLRNLGLVDEEESTPVPFKQPPRKRFGHLKPIEINSNFLFDPEATPKATDYQQRHDENANDDLSSKENECISVIENGARPRKPEAEQRASQGTILRARLTAQNQYANCIEELSANIRQLSDMKERIFEANQSAKSVGGGGPRSPIEERSSSPDYTIEDFTDEKCQYIIDVCIRSRKFLRDVRKDVLVRRREAAKAAGNKPLKDHLFEEMKKDVNDCKKTTELLQAKLDTLKAAQPSGLERAVFYIDRILDLSGWQLATIELVESVEKGALSSFRLHEELSRLLKLVESLRDESENKRVALLTPKRSRSVRTPLRETVEVQPERIQSPPRAPSPADDRAKDTDYDISSLQDLEEAPEESEVQEIQIQEPEAQPPEEQLQELPSLSDAPLEASDLGLDSVAQSNSTQAKSTTEATSSSTTTEKTTTEASEATSTETKDDQGESKAQGEPEISEMDEVQTAADSSSANLDSLWQNDGSLNLSQGQLNLSQSFLDTSLNTSRRRTYVTGGTISKMRNSMSPIGDRSTTQWPSSPKRGDHNKSVEKSFNDSLDFELTSAWNDVAVPDSVIPGLDSVHFDSTFSVAAPVSVQGQLEAVVNRLQKTRPKTLEELRPKLLAIAQKLLPSVEEGHSEAPLAYRNHLEQLGENRLELFDQASNSYDAYIEDLCVDAVRKVLLPGDLKYSAPLIRCARSFPRTEEELVALFEAQLEGKLSILRSNYTERLSSSKRGDRVFIEKHKNRPAEDRFVLDVLMPETFGSIERKVQDAMVASFSEDSELTNTDTSSQARD